MIRPISRYVTSMPAGVVRLHLLSIFSAVGFASLLGTLNLYLQSKGMSATRANDLTASFFGLNFLLHFLSGVIGGRWLSFRSLMVYSLSLQLIGLIGIASPSLPITLIAMGIFIAGAGLFTSTMNMMLTQRFATDDPRRRTAFSVNYGCLNLGFLGSFIIADLFQAHHHYSSLFLIAAANLLLSLLLHLSNWRAVPDQDTLYCQQIGNPILRIKAMSCIALCALIAIFLMHHSTLASSLIDVVFIAAAIGLVIYAMRQSAAVRGRLVAYLILVTACLLYAFCQGLLSTGLTDFVQYNTNQSLLGIAISPAGVPAIDNITVILFSIWFAKRAFAQHQGKALPAEQLVYRGLFLNSLGFLFVPLGIFLMRHFGWTSVPLMFPALLLIFMAFAEVHVNATAFSLAGELVNPRVQGLFTGYLFLNTALGINLSGPISNLMIGEHNKLQHLSAAQTNPVYFKLFLELFVAAFVMTLIYRQLRPVILRLRTRCE